MKSGGNERSASKNEKLEVGSPVGLHLHSVIVGRIR
jgi:hypothetical protein